MGMCLGPRTIRIRPCPSAIASQCNLAPKPRNNNNNNNNSNDNNSNNCSNNNNNYKFGPIMVKIRPYCTGTQLNWDAINLGTILMLADKLCTKINKQWKHTP